MADKVVIRRATEQDLDFIVDTIIESQKSGTNQISYCNIYSINEAELRKLLKKVLIDDLEGITGHEFCLSGFLICEINGEYAGALGSWIEGIDGIPSSIIKMNLLLKHLGRKKLEDAAEKYKIIRELFFEREDGAMQLEYFLVKDKFRLKGVFVKLLIAQIKKHISENRQFRKAQTMMLKNDRPFLASLRIGFEIIEEKTATNEEILKIFPHDTRLMMEMKSTEFPRLMERFQRHLANTEILL